MNNAVLAFNHLFQDDAVGDGDGTAMVVGGLSGVGVQIEGVTTAVINFEVTIDEVTWYAAPAVNLTDQSMAVTASADGVFVVPVGGMSRLRCRISGYAAGTVVVSGKGTTNEFPLTALAAATLGAGEAHIGQVGGEGITISQTPTVTAGAYSANDAVGGLLTFANAGRVSGGGGVIKDLIVLDDAGQDAELELWLFRETFTAMVDNAAWAPSEADLRKLIAVIRSRDGNWLAAGTPSALVVEVAQRYDLVGTSLFGQVVTKGTPTFAATDDVTVIIGLLQD